jgi:hypothetical protein
MNVIPEQIIFVSRGITVLRFSSKIQLHPPLMASSRDVFQLTNVPVLSEVGVTFLSSVIVVTANGQFWIVPLLYSVNDMYVACS